ncbi:hypothetical protein SAMN04488109_5177 [Chryseolinea serpens]|jgi:hypothetical protein|uniref:Phosphatidate cytidylyltransferase n=1 Tax=Chryseolinea serpens TaxID=947013 RepID=A0A1M5VKI3_9BACT|nr:hypothetical protein [Chryseolinea serpens]SHH75725.1 hypothetical protein SAMN04488109_5177 [Chryseolinea serpens]
MKLKNINAFAFFIFLLVTVTSCQVIGDIFGAGVYTGIFIVIFIIVIIFILLSKVFRKP